MLEYLDKLRMYLNVESVDSSVEKTTIVFLHGVTDEETDRYNEWFEETYSHPVMIDWRDPRTVEINHLDCQEIWVDGTVIPRRKNK